MRRVRSGGSACAKRKLSIMVALQMSALRTRRLTAADLSVLCSRTIEADRWSNLPMTYGGTILTIVTTKHSAADLHVGLFTTSSALNSGFKIHTSKTVPPTKQVGLL